MTDKATNECLVGRLRCPDAGQDRLQALLDVVDLACASVYSYIEPARSSRSLSAYVPLATASTDMQTEAEIKPSPVGLYSSKPAVGLANALRSTSQGRLLSRALPAHQCDHASFPHHEESNMPILHAHAHASRLSLRLSATVCSVPDVHGTIVRRHCRPILLRSSCQRKKNAWAAWL